MHLTVLGTVKVEDAGPASGGAKDPAVGTVGVVTR